MNREKLKQQIVKNFEDAEITEKERLTNTMYCIDAHIKQLSILPVMQWVAVEDKLPKEMEWVLAYDAIGKQVRYMRRIDDLGWQMGRFCIQDVTHWMPIPKPPCA